MGNNKSTENNSVKFYVALQGNKTPEEYIRLGKHIEALGYDRIYVYDDLMYRPAWPILSLIAANTESIELGPCLVNGFYSHPAIIAENAAFLDEISGERAVLGIGRGAFFDYLNMNLSEHTTRNGCEETILLVKRFLTRSNAPFKGKFFEATEKAVLRWDPPRSDIPIVLGSWNTKMAYIAGKHCDEMQAAECWETEYISQLYGQLCLGAGEAGRPRPPYFSIGGITCISTDETAAVEKVKLTLAVYLPYLKGIMSKSGININKKNIKMIDLHSKTGRFHDSIPFIPDDVVHSLSLSGTPTRVTEKLEALLSSATIRGILLSPPYGTLDTIEDNLELIMEQVISKIK
jgi:5,10-methylenetetrahydromethanopterin reductase